MIHESPSATKPVSSSSPYQIIKCSADIKKKELIKIIFFCNWKPNMDSHT